MTQPDVLELDRHRRSGVKLQSEDPFPLCFRMIVSQVHRGHAIDLMNLPIANRDDGQLVPFAIDKLLVLVADFTNDLWPAVRSNHDPLETLGNNPSPFLCVEHSEELWLRVQIRLITFSDKVFRLADQLAAVLHSGVVSCKADLRLEHEVGDVATLPDKKRVAFCRLVLRSLPKDRAVFNGPELRLTGPAGEVFPIEEGLEFLSTGGSTENRNQHEYGE